MDIKSANAVFPRMIDPSLSRVLPQQETEKNMGASFSEMLFGALNNVNERQRASSEATQDLLTGDLDNLHELMIRAEEARLSLHLAIQTTSKVVEAYRELSRMQI